MRKLTSKNKFNVISNERSYLCEKKWLIISLAWLGYFPIVFNDRLSKFQMRLNSWPFILHSLRAVVFLTFYAGFLLINTNPNKWKVTPVNEDSNQTKILKIIIP